MSAGAVRRIASVAWRGGLLVVVLLATVFAVCIGVAGAAAPLGEIVEFGAPGTDPAQIQSGPDGNLWFSDRNGSVGRATTAGVVTRFTVGLNPGSAVRSIAMGHDGNMWFSDPGTTRAVGMIDPLTQVISEFSVGLNAGSMPLGIAAGPDGNVWFTDNGTIKAIGMINPVTHAISEFSVGLNAGAALQQGLVAGPDGNLWFTDGSTTPAIGRINPTTRAISEFSVGLNPASRPGASIIVGPDGALWFMNGGTNTIGRIDPTTQAINEYGAGLNPGAALGRLAVGPDGNIWFGDKGTTKAIGKIDPTTKAITLYGSGLSLGSLPGGAGTGSDGNVWFTDQGTTKAVGRIGVGAPAASVTLPSVSGTGGAGVAQSCGGDTWSNWAGTQPSHTAFGFDGYQWLLDGNPLAGATGSSYTPAADDAGHQLSCLVTVTYTLFPVTVSATSAAVHVSGAAEQLDDLADAVAGVGPGKSLAAKAAAIEGAVEANDTAEACATLNDFINEVNAQTGKKISTALAASLIAQAHGIRAALGC
jgi:virginiamycin B lyase